jgi:SAM-dependent methyltransferase
MLHTRFKNDGIAVYKMTALQEAARDAIAKKIANNGYEMVEESCPACGESEHAVLSQKDMYGLPMTVAVCQACDFVYTQKRLTDKSLIDFYDGEYRQLDRAVSGIDPFYALQQRKGQLLYDFLKGHNFLKNTLAKSDFIVEIGCGAGGILHYFRDKGYSTVGCDFGSEYLNYGREKYDLTLIDGGLVELAPFFETPNRKPAIVIYEQVLEHIFNLDEELVELKKLITPDTLLYIGVPGIRNLEHPRYEYDLLPFLQIPHLVHFDLQSLQKLMHRHGFELLEGNELVRAVFQYKGDKIAPLKLKSNVPKMAAYFAEMEQKRGKLEQLKTVFFPYFWGKKMAKKVEGRVRQMMK